MFTHATDTIAVRTMRHNWVLLCQVTLYGEAVPDLRVTDVHTATQNVWREIWDTVRLRDGRTTAALCNVWSLPLALGSARRGFGATMTLWHLTSARDRIDHFAAPRVRGWMCPRIVKVTSSEPLSSLDPSWIMFSVGAMYASPGKMDTRNTAISPYVARNLLA